MPTERYRVMVNIPPEWKDAFDARAISLNRPFANYVETLIIRDLKQAQAEAINSRPAPNAINSSGPSAECSIPPNEVVETLRKQHTAAKAAIRNADHTPEKSDLGRAQPKKKTSK